MHKVLHDPEVEKTTMVITGSLGLGRILSINPKP